MRPIVLVVSSLTVAQVCASGQAAGAPSFEVASVKPSSPSAQAIVCSGGPGTADPGLWRCSNVPLGYLITRAYGFEAYQFHPHDPCCQARFDFTARVPRGATKEQFQRMLGNLLVERFKLAFHLEPKEMPVYELTVAEKGPKIKESAPDGVPAPEDPWEIPKYTIGKDGYPEFPAGHGGLQQGMGGRYRWAGLQLSMPEIVKTLSFHLGRPVIDTTGLTGRYDFDLRWGIDLAWLAERAGPGIQAPEAPDTGTPGPPLLRAVQDQLGLKLTSKKGVGEIVVIDHLEKVPIEN